jgi:tetratricopeptide (TPR) repeat protein
VVGALRVEEPNLLHARALALRNGWWSRVISTMQGLRHLYAHTGRRAEWARLVEEIVPDFIDPATEGPLPGREEDWRLVTDYRVRLVRDARQWAEAERLQDLLVEWNRGRARDDDRNSQRTLAASLQGLGQIQWKMGRRECVAAYRESFDLAQRIGDGTGAAVVAFSLGHACIDLRDLSEAERWYRRSLELRAEGDWMVRASCLGELGHVALERFQEARRAKQPEVVLQRHLHDALGYCHQALEMTPPDAIVQLAVGHDQLGSIYGEAGQLDRALPQFRESIRYQELAGNLYDAARARNNVALVLLNARRFADARDYAHAALRNFQTYGASAQQDIQKTLDLIARIDKDSHPH